MKPMKVRLFILLCFVSPFLKGGPLSERLHMAQRQFLALPEHLTIGNIDCILQEIDTLDCYKGKKTHAESVAILVSMENGDFLELLKEYLQNPDNRDLANSLQQYARCTPRFYDFLQQAIEKNPENEVLKNINLDFPVWWKKNRF